MTEKEKTHFKFAVLTFFLYSRSSTEPSLKEQSKRIQNSQSKRSKRLYLKKMKLRVEVPSATQSPAESTSLNLIQNLIQRLVKPKWIHSFIGSFRIKEHPERIRKQPIKTKQTQVKLKLVSVTLFSPSLYLSTFSAQQSTDFILKRWNWELQCQVFCWKLKFKVRYSAFREIHKQM